MKLYYYQDPVGNFGDDLNPLIWDHLAPEILNGDASTILVGIGTIINTDIPACPRKFVFGSGAGYGPPPIIDEKWKFYCVRGPLTAQKLGLDKSLAITDPAILIKQIIDFPKQGSSEAVSFMPHHSSMQKGDWTNICKAAGVNYIAPTESVSHIISKIRESRLVIAEAMHAAIVADAFRIPWIPVRCYDHILDFKWRDWCQSLNLEYLPVKLPGLWNVEHKIPVEARLKNEIKHVLKNLKMASKKWTPPLPRKASKRESELATTALVKIAKNTSSFLSKDRCHEDSTQRLLIKLDELKRDSILLANSKR